MNINYHRSKNVDAHVGRGTGAVVVHEWIEPTGGSEVVVECLMSLIPDADLYCLWDDDRTRFPADRVIESPLARTPLRRSKALSIPAQLATWRRVPGRYDFAIVSSHAFAHHARFPQSPDLRKFVYVHSPARYLWAPELDERGAGLRGRIAGGVLRAADRRGARDDRLVAANSAFVANRVRRAWGQESTVIHPPVDTDRIADTDWEATLTDGERGILDALPETFVFSVGRLIDYKRFDKVIELSAATGIPAVIAGGGPRSENLIAMKEELGAPVILLGRVSDALMYSLHRRAAVFAFFGIEDFGITTVEAMATGTPVVAADVGGSAEIVVDGRTGALCDVRSPAELRSALDAAVSCDPAAVRARAGEFSAQVFRRRVSDWVGLDPPPAG